VLTCGWFYACRHLKDATNTFDRKHRLHTFSVGIGGSPDLIAAKKVADFLGTVHHELTFTVDQGLDALSDLIYHIESYEQVQRTSATV
jgi:asparagine synthase (glutamine-hydrolysing)